MDRAELIQHLSQILCTSFNACASIIAINDPEIRCRSGHQLGKANSSR